MFKCLYCYKELEKGEIDFHLSCSVKMFGDKKAPILDYSLDEMEVLAQKVIETSISVPGVQPKLSLGFIKDQLVDGQKGRLTVLDALEGSYILKPQNYNYPEMPENEHLTMRLAEICGILTVNSSLIRLKSKELCYITKRIDRESYGLKLHMLDMFQITEAFDKYKSSMEKVGKAVQSYTSNTLFDLLRLFELVIFYYITGNNDMHLKNFSLLLENENWKLSPAYDLLNVQLHLPEDNEESALTILGKKSKFTQNDFIQLGLKYGLNEKQIFNTFKRFIKSKNKMMILINESFLSEENKERYKLLLIKRLNIFE